MWGCRLSRISASGIQIASPDDEKRAIAAGFNAYFPKPFDAAEVIDTIAKTFEGPRRACCLESELVRLDELSFGIVPVPFAQMR